MPEPTLLRRAACLTLLFLCAFTAARPQNVSGTILGTVRDSSGGVIAAARISVTNEATNFGYNGVTASTGEYVVPNLPPGQYSVASESAGFKQNVVKGVALLPNRSVRVDMVLEPGAVAQTVEVQATAPVVNSENSTIGNIMDTRTIVTLPLNGRTLDRLIRISAGVTTDSASNPRVAGSSYWGGVQFNVDGVTYNDFGNGGGAYSFASGLSTVPSVDAVSEFKIDSNNQKAEFEGSTSVTIVTKSGSNEFHGSAYEFNRNRAYAAKNGRATGLPKPPLNRNDFGATVGGRLIKDRTFFFAGYEGLRERSSSTRTSSIATQAMRNGDFSGLPTIIDPLSRQPFTDNKIPANRIDDRAKTLIDVVPLPNAAGTGPAGTLNNYVANIRNIYDVNRVIGRVDHRFSPNDSLFASINYSKGSPYFVGRSGVQNFGNGGDFGYLTKSGQLTYTHNFSARTLNEARVAWFYHGSIRQGQNLDFDPMKLFPELYGGYSFGGLPTVNIASHLTIGDYGGFERSPQYTAQYVDNLTHVAGKHTIKAGIDFANYRNYTPPFSGGFGSNLLQEATFGRFDFDGRYTNSTTGAAQPAHSFADFLLGNPVRTYRSTPTSLSLFYQTRYSAYVQDDFQVSSRLSLSFGLRYMVQTTWRERDNGVSNFDFATGKLVIPSATLPPQGQAALLNAYPIVLDPNDTVYNSDRNNFAPRFGFAYRPFADSKTVIRGGAGVYHNPIAFFVGVRALNFSNPPYQLSETFEAAAGTTPSLTLARPFATSSTISANPAITVMERNLKNGDSYQWNLTVEREVVANLGLRASYVGNHTAHLPYNGRQLNFPQTYAPGQIQPRRPYQPWSSIGLVSSGGDSAIHQLQLEAVKRYSGGLNFQIEYSWNRSLDNTPISGGPEDPYNNARDRGNSDQVRRHIFTAAYSYELPFGTGKHFLNFRGVAGKFVSGWQIAGITYLRTGQPFSVNFNTSVAGWGSGRADIVKDPTLSRGERSEYRWFDTTAFAVPQQFTYGNSARNLLFAPGDIVFDMSLLKDTRIGERYNVQFRLESFNLPNHANLGAPGNNISVPGSVGRITSVGDPRQIQLGMKFLF
jgi:hypothetical protein